MASVGDDAFLVQAATYLGAAAVAVPVFKRLRLGTILGFLAAGVAIGPSGLGLLSTDEGVFHVAEFGVVLFLFVIGLELSFGRLWALKRTIFGLGLLQMLLTGLVIGACLDLSGVLTTGASYVAGFALACSSTAFVLTFLQERGELNSPYGTKSFSVLLFQDLAVIPLLAAIPFVAQAEGRAGSGQAEGALAVDWLAIGFAALVIAAVILLGRFALNPFFRLVARSGSREAFTAAALFVVAATALLVAGAGLSMALGAFLAGVLLAESSYRHQIEADIEPFRELLLGLFFIGVGMQLDLSVVAERWAFILAATLALLSLKAGILFVLARLFGGRDGESVRVAAMLSQGGEFGFVVFSLGVGEGLFPAGFVIVASAIVTLSMTTTPLLVPLAARVGRRPSSGHGLRPAAEAGQGQVLLIGFGRFGQIIAQVLIGAGASVTAVDRDPDRIRTAQSFGHEVYYGDVTNMNVLVQAGALTADVIVLALKDAGQSQRTVEALRERCPKVRIVVRAYDRVSAIALMDSGADLIVRETLESALKAAGKTLGFLGRPDALVDDMVAEFRERDEERMLAQKAEGLYARKEDALKPFAAARREERERSQEAS